MGDRGMLIDEPEITGNKPFEGFIKPRHIETID